MANNLVCLINSTDIWRVPFQMFTCVVHVLLFVYHFKRPILLIQLSDQWKGKSLALPLLSPCKLWPNSLSLREKEVLNSLDTKLLIVKVGSCFYSCSCTTFMILLNAKSSMFDLSRPISTQDPNLWVQTLSYFARKEENCKQYIVEVLSQIDRYNLLPPLMVIQTLAHNSSATLSVVKVTSLVSVMTREYYQYCPLWSANNINIAWVIIIIYLFPHKNTKYKPKWTRYIKQFD